MPWSTRGRKQDKCVDAEIRLQGQYALHLPSRSRPWALASSRGWLEALRPPAETTLGSEGIWVRKWEVVFKAPGKRLKATCRWAGLRNPLWGHEDACRVSPGPQSPQWSEMREAHDGL